MSNLEEPVLKYMLDLVKREKFVNVFIYYNSL